MICRFCSKLHKNMKNFIANFPGVFFCEKNLVYFCPLWHILKHNLAYFVFVHLATLVKTDAVFHSVLGKGKKQIQYGCLDTASWKSSYGSEGAHQI